MKNDWILNVPDPRAQSCILIVDDTPANLELLANNLHNYGYKITIAGNSEAALERAKKILPDIILLDIMMPGIDGLETCRRLKSAEETKDIPVIFMTALSDIEHKKKGFMAGGVDYLTKPIQNEELIARVTAHLEIQQYRKHLEDLVDIRTQKLNEEVFEHKKTADQLRKTLKMLEIRTREMLQSQQQLCDVKLNKALIELKSLKSQINPHFLYNTLESIKMMAVIKGEEEVGDAITQLGDLFRYTIKDDDDFVFIQDEIALSESYLSLLKLRYQEKLQYSFEVDTALRRRKTVKFILQPIIENAVYHGIVPKQGPGTIQIFLKDRGGALEFIVEDDGVGMVNRELERLRMRINRIEEEESPGIGLMNVNKRIKLLCGRDYGVTVYGELNQGFTVSILFPDETRGGKSSD